MIHGLMTVLDEDNNKFDECALHQHTQAHEIASVHGIKFHMHAAVYQD